MDSKKMLRYEMPHYTEYDLMAMDKEHIVWAYCLLQDRFEHLRDCDYPDLEERLRIMTVRMFGRSSEKSRILSGSGDDKKKKVDTRDPEETPDNDTDDLNYGHEDGKESEGKKRPTRTCGCADRVIKDLPVIDEDVELTPDELEAVFGTGVKYVDDPNFEKTYEEVCTLPSTHYVIRYHIHVYRGNGKIVPAAHVEKMKKNSLQTPDLMAEIVNDRCVLQLPMHRIAQEMAREGFRLTRQTIARWCIDFGTEYLEPMILRMLDVIVHTGYMQADETPMIIGRTLDNRRQEARQWVFRTSTLAGDRQVIVFYFDETRSTDVLRELMGSLEQELVIICDSYVSYKAFSKEMNGLVTISNCLTHARRNFTDILKAIPGFKKLDEKGKQQILSYRIVKMMDEIFEKERDFKDMNADERRSHRISESEPVLSRMITALKDIPRSDFDKSSKLYEAVNYIIGQEDNFRVFLKDGNVPVHNSGCEQAIIPFALGRNGWKAIDSIDGGITLGYYYSITETAKANGAVPFYYLKFLFERLPELIKEKGKNPQPELFDDMMPWTEQYRSYEKAAIESSRNTLERIGKMSMAKNSA